MIHLSVSVLLLIRYLRYHPVTTAHMSVIFLRGTTCFYRVSEVQIHAWFRPTATRVFQRGCKYDHA